MSFTTYGTKTTDLSVLYWITAILSLVILAAYCIAFRKKDLWYILLYSSISIVNIGYLILSYATTLDMALWANRISYFGSALLPFAMLMLILNASNIEYKKYLPIALAAIGFIVFLIAASPGYLDIYYKEVSLEFVDGVAHLKKVYGPWHNVYLIYLLGYFSSMIYAIAYSYFKKKVDSVITTVLLAGAVLVSIGVWFIEQIVELSFEMLSVSYIICELFLMGLYMLMSEAKRLKELAEISQAPQPSAANKPKLPASAAEISADKLLIFSNGREALTPTEFLIYESYLMGKSTKDILTELNIKENTLKFHNKNIYSKLGVSSRKELIAISKAIK